MLERPIFAALAALFFAALVFFAVAAFGWNAGHAFINADAWSIWDMARTVDERFYRIAMIRQFHLQPLEYGVSYPFLAPLATYALDRVSGLGVYALFVLAAVGGWVAAGLTAPALARACPGAPRGAVVLGALLMAATAMNIGEFYRDVYRASTIPMALAFIMAAVCIVADGATTARRAALAGLAMGLGCMTRFDVNLPAAGFVLVVFLAAERNRVRATLAYVAALGLAVSPWIIYSLSVFGRPYASDNSIVAVAVRQLHSLDVVLPGEPTLWTDFAGWRERVGAAAVNCVELLQAQMSQTPYAWIIVSGLAATIAAAALWPRDAAGRRGGGPGVKGPVLLTLTAALSSTVFVGPIVTGYQMNTRYYSIAFFFWALAAVAWALTAAGRGRGPAVIVQAGFAALTCAALFYSPREPFADGVVRPAFPPANMSATAHPGLDACLPAHGRTLMAYRWTDMKLQDAIRFSALARRSALVMPHNWEELSPEVQTGFLKSAGVTHVLTDPAASPAGLLPPDAPRSTEPDCAGLYRLGGPE